MQDQSNWNKIIFLKKRKTEREQNNQLFLKKKNFSSESTSTREGTLMNVIPPVLELFFRGQSVCSEKGKG